MRPLHRARDHRRRSCRLGAWLAAVAFSPALAAMLLAVGLGVLAQAIREVVDLNTVDAERALACRTVGGFLGGLVLLFVLDVAFIDVVLLYAARPDR